jgi:hypothetical protein
VPKNKYKSSGGSILIQGTWIGKREGRQWRNDAPRICLLSLESIRDERDKERELKAMPRSEMTVAQEYKADILQSDSLMYVPVDWGESDSPNNKRRQGQVVSTRHRAKPRVREHFKGLIKSPGTNTTNVVENLSPA